MAFATKGSSSSDTPKCFRDDLLKWNGWGYQDTSFEVSPRGDIYMCGTRYPDLSGKPIPQLRPWIENNVGVDLNYRTPSIELDQIRLPEPIINAAFAEFLRSHDISNSTSPLPRINRSHGQTLHDILAVRRGDLTNSRIPDMVVWPKGEDEVEKVLEGASRFGVTLIPYGGGTNVSGALSCPKGEERSIISLDMSLMDKLLWIDEANLLCRAQAGIIGQNLERQLQERGYTCGHEPDSVEFSSLGGWISTRASGMKKNKYGNIEDLVVQVNLITPQGKLRRNCQVPRQSSGPDMHHIILGSEGTYGVISEATIKIFPAPAYCKHGSILFPDYSHGIAFFREVARQRCQCASLRLVDNEQFIMGQAMKTKAESIWEEIKSKLARLYVTAWKGYDSGKMTAATCVFEGSQEEVEAQEARLYRIGTSFGGLPAGEENGKYGYRLTFAIAYLRDLAMDYSVIGESFETSVPWSMVERCCNNVKALLVREASRHGIHYPVLATSRVTQLYDSGACIYFYFGFNYRGLNADPVEVYEEIEIAARNEILACGGSISHHHGIGKLRKRWMPTTVGEVGLSVLKAIKQDLDPNNILAVENLIDADRRCKL